MKPKLESIFKTVYNSLKSEFRKIAPKNALSDKL